MLVLTRRVGEEICIGDDIVLKVTGLQSGRVKLGVSAPRSCRITRGEFEDVAEAKRQDSVVVEDSDLVPA